MSVRKFSKEHEWVELDGSRAVVGITDFAQSALGDVVFVDLPAVGRELQQGKDCAVVESVKAASDVYAPISGVVVSVNPKLSDDPGLLNRDAGGEGWLFAMEATATAEMDSLMDESAYKAYLGTLG